MPNKIFKSFTTSFVSHLGSHGRGKHLHKDLGVDDWNKHCGKMAGDSSPVSQSDFEKSSSVMGKIGKFGEALRTANRITSGLVPGTDNSLLGLGNALISFMSQSEASDVGKTTKTYYFKTFTHIGTPTSRRIKKLSDNAFIEKETKCFTDTLSDYQSHADREKLKIQQGFNEKCFTWLAEDTYFTLNDFIELYKVDKRFGKELRQIGDGKTDIYGCTTKSYFKLRLKNRLSDYSAHVQIHLIKILDHEMDIREVINEITNNSTQKSHQDNLGRLPKDFQYTDPITTDYKNKCQINFLTDLRCRLTQSSKFRENCRIVRSWSRCLAPSSIWDFNMTTHLGKGLHLNTIYDLYLRSDKFLEEEKENESKEIKLNPIEMIKAIHDDFKKDKKLKASQETLKEISNLLRKQMNAAFSPIKGLHPASYVICIETVGDRRSSITRVANNDMFDGYSPCQLHFEFSKHLQYLTESGNIDNLLVYKKIQQERNFGEDSEFGDIFCPQRASRFHVPFDEIGFPGKIKKGDKDFSYKMEYDNLISSTPDLPKFMDSLVKNFEKLGFSGKEAMPDDINLNFKETDNNDNNDEIIDFDATTTPERPESRDTPDDTPGGLRG